METRGATAIVETFIRVAHSEMTANSLKRSVSPPFAAQRY